MSEFICCNISNLWDEILKRHWTYLETEEGKQKVEEYKKLEGCLKDFLSVVRHDRKFFLPETMQILQNSIRNLENFNINKAIAAFEAISQYANNLFTKPWRKEFCIVKMYSGFYQHEIRQNLIEAEKLFEAMGYRCVSNQMLILDGPICPDQVTNVSRDAMAAYMELNIIKYIHNGLENMGLPANWLDIYYFREKHIGGITQTINSLSCLMKRRLSHNDKCLSLENGYSIPQSSATIPTMATMVERNSCQCNGYYNQSSLLPNHTNRGENLIYNNNAVNYNQTNENTNSAVLHKNFCKTLQNEYDGNTNTANLRNGHTTHTHEAQIRGYSNGHAIHPQCLPSYKHYGPIYEYLDGNSLDGSSNISYIPEVTANSNAGNELSYIHPYNVPGNRYPLTYLSQQLTNHYDCQPVANNLYATVANKTHNNYKIPVIYNSIPAANNQLIYLNNPANCYHTNTHYEPNDENEHHIDYRRQYDLDDNHTVKLNGFPPNYLTPNTADKLALHDQMYMYARPYHKEQQRILYKQRYDNSLPKSTTAYLSARPKSNSLQLNCREDLIKEDVKRKNIYHMNMEEETTVTDHDCCDASRDYLVKEKRCQDYSPIQLSRNQDGVGSFESWDYVFQNLERNENHKNFIDGEEEEEEEQDAIIKTIDLTSMNLTKKSSPSPSSGTLSAGAAKSTTHTSINSSEKVKIPTKPLDKVVKTNKSQTPTNPMNETRKMTSFGNNKTTKHNHLPASNIQEAKHKKSLTPNRLQIDNQESIINNNNINNNNDNDDDDDDDVIDNQSEVVGRGRGRACERERGRTRTSKNHIQAERNSSLQNSSTQIVVSAPNEWSCRFCTFLNPDTRRICQMCCRTNDSNVNASSKSSTRSPSPRCL